MCSYQWYVTGIRTPGPGGQRAAASVCEGVPLLVLAGSGGKGGGYQLYGGRPRTAL
eukprot:COSAG01_NODE_37585_length_501_cov_2.388060_1_plen_55_part_01